MATKVPGDAVTLTSTGETGRAKAVSADSIKSYILLTKSDGQSKVYWEDNTNLT